MTDPTTVARPEDLIAFWFAESSQARWFDSTVAFDQTLRERFLATYRAAADGQLAEWEQTPAGALALAIALDQFPLNMFRGKPESFATEAAARAVAERAIAREFDRELKPMERLFLYLPFMHSENLADQDRSVQWFDRLGLDDSARFARHHRDLIVRFGRFPHRNAILGRDNTAEEIAYLASPEAFHG
ncbi:MAG: DUF924 domain-containing protein [Candidatus Competibacteraceae bacterium]|nr:DUF924 domain-containing protein [Candidatus Competibacteraceae bacterium]